MINYSALLNMIVSPCHPRFGCEHMNEDKTICSQSCDKLPVLEKFLNDYRFNGFALTIGKNRCSSADAEEHSYYNLPAVEEHTEDAYASILAL